MAQLSVLPRIVGSPARAERSRIRFQDFGLYGIAALGLFAIALIWLGAAQFIREDQRRAEDSAALSAANLARAFEDHTLRSLRSIDQLLLFARASYRKGPAGFDLPGWLQQQNFITDIAVELSIIDAAGLLVASSAPSAAPRMDFGRREYFLAHAGTERDELLISKPAFGQTTRKWSIHLTRRISAADGSF